MVPGVYYGRTKFISESIWYDSVLSIGYNPYYKNEAKTCVRYLILGNIFNS